MPKVKNDDLKSLVFLRAVLDAFEDKMLAYYNASATDEERRRRALEIAGKVRVIKFKDGAITFTIGAKKVTKKIKDATGVSTVIDYKCKEDEFCCSGTCLPNGTPCIQ